MITLEARDIQSVYSGKPNKCCCGCAGKHSYNSLHQKAASKSRGYKVEDDDVNDRQVARVLDIIKASGESLVVGSNNLSAIVNGRLYIAYPQAWHR